MTIDELIRCRYSCRSYADTPVDRALVEEICRVALLAPSACNSQPWKIHALYGEKKNAVAKTLRQEIGFNRHASAAPVLLAIEETDAVYKKAIAEAVEPNRWTDCDVGILAAHIVLLAKDRGLDTCIIGFADTEALKKELGTQNPVPLLISLGYAANPGTVPAKKRKDTEDVFVEEE